MKHYFSLFSALLFTGLSVFAQPKITTSLHFKNSEQQLNANVESFNWNAFSKFYEPINGKRFAIIQFRIAPSESIKKQLLGSGIMLLSYIQHNTFTAVISKQIDRSVLINAGVISVADLDRKAKLDKKLLQLPFPAYAINKPGTIDVLVNLSKGLAIDEAITDLQKRQFQVIDTHLQTYHVVTIRLPQSQVALLSSVPYIAFIQPLPPADKILNDEVRSNARANVLNAPIANGGENLTGKGVVIGVGDNADITSHVDLKDRVINRSAFLFENHGTQTSGVAAGAGIKEAVYQGVAPQATIVSQIFGGIYKSAASYVADYGMVVTNNSYGSITGECEYAGVYDIYSKVLDEQSFALPELLHVFAAGNDGLISCPGYARGFHTVLGGYQSAKNILTVGWGEKNASASANGSFGPTTDGRIKPEITTTGSEVRSTGKNNSYVTDWGSSLASPAVTGGAALLIEKYRQLYGGANPKNGLLKALLMNGANDIGNPGPDYKSGFGWMNLNRSLAMIKDNHFITGTIATGNISNHIIKVPAGSSQLKVMIYWNDPAAAVFNPSSLVNDIDLEVINTTNAVILPWKLDSTHNNVDNIAIRGVDRINNVEQVTIDNPAAGDYTIRVKGTAINANASQEYFIVYDFLPATIDLTFPSVGEPLVAGETITINWDAWDNATNTYTLQYSVDGGANWTNISTNIPAGDKQYSWVVPAVATSNAKMRILRNGTSLSDESVTFVIAPEIAVNASPIQCEGYISISWTAVPAASGYEVMMKQGPQMEPITVTTSNNFILGGLNKDSIYWITVRALINNKPGRRADALRFQPNSGSCSGSISNNDLKLDSILAPLTGRVNTSTQITSTGLRIRIKNLDDVAVNNFEVKYSINGGAFVSQSLSVVIPPQATYIHTITGLNFSQQGEYRIVAVVKNSITDPVLANDTLISVIKQLPNNEIELPYVENFETAPTFEVVGNKMGLDGLDHWDFTASSVYGRLRNFVNSGIAHSGNKAITLDANRFVQAGNTNYFIGTFNMNQYNASSDEVRFDFWFKHHSQNANKNNRVWIRGSDNQNWIEVLNLDSIQEVVAGRWQKMPSIEVSKYLLAYNQNFTTSFQVRFGQFGVIAMGDNQHNAGYTIDDFRMYIASNDVSVVKIESPESNSCNLGNNVPLKVLVKNLSNISLSNIPVKAQLDQGPIITETIPFIAANTTIGYTFSAGINFSALGAHTINVWTELAADTYKENDSILNYIVINQPLISTFPYIENFENGKGNWYAEGYNNSWEFGTPASLKINKAASGSKAWKTTLQGSYNDNELSYLYSPCFNVSGLSNPWLSLSIAMDFEQCNNEPCDKAWIEYSTDGASWIKLGAYGAGSNWYNQKSDHVWDSAGFKRWHSAGIPLPAGLNNMRLRVVINSDESLIKEGIAIDDIHIYDRAFGIYTGNSITNPITKDVVGNAWQHFTQGDKIIASVNPNNNNLGSTGVQVFIHKSGIENVHNSNGQYFHNRNITVKPALVSQTDSTTIRFYFTDKETDTLTRATNCTNCSKPVDAYGLGITKYDDSDDSKENGDMGDNSGGLYSFINSTKVIKVPYDIGYYAEFKVKDFSEFWLSDGNPNANLPLPLLLTDFKAARQNNNVMLQWSAANERNISKYEVEVATSNEAYNLRQFNLLATVTAKNTLQTNYNVTDAEPNKNGARYYRLKITDKSGLVTYGPVKVVVFANTREWKVYPNPVKDMVQVVIQAEAGSAVEIKLVNVMGQVLLNKAVIATGFPDKISLNLNGNKIPSGLYLIKVSEGQFVRQFKVVKQ